MMPLPKTKERQIGPKEELQLILNAKNGDRNSFDQLAEQYLPRIFGYCLSLRPKNHDDAKDIIQETLVSAWSGLGRFEIGRPILPWLCKITKNELKRMYKHRNARMQSLQEQRDSDGGWDVASPADENEIDEIVSLVIECDILRKVFEQCGYPWQVLSYGFGKLFFKRLPNKRSRREWPPRRVHKELSLLELQSLETHFESEFLSHSMVPQDVVRRDLEPLRNKLTRSVGEIIVPTDGDSRQNFRKILGQKVGSTVLRNYYTRPEGADIIASWTLKVEDRVFAIVLDCLEKKGV